MFLKKYKILNTLIIIIILFAILQISKTTFSKVQSPKFLVTDYLKHDFQTQVSSLLPSFHTLSQGYCPTSNQCYNRSMTDPKLTHIDEDGNARMVDVGDKSVTSRMAIAKGEIVMKLETLNLIREGQIKKGDVLTVAKVAGIAGGKRTADLIPFCHPLPLNFLSIEFEIDEKLPGVRITALAKTDGKTGIEMEALTAVSITALTIYDMAKAAEKTMKIQNIRLVEKRGGKSGDVFNE